MEHEGEGDINCIWWVWNGLGKGWKNRKTKDDGWLAGCLVGFIGISNSIGYLMPKPVYTYVWFVRGMSRDHPNYRIVEIDYNTEKSHGNLREHVVTQTLVKDNYQRLVRKTRNNTDNIDNGDSNSS